MAADVRKERQLPSGEEGHVDRMIDLELLKALAIIAMILCHPVLRLGVQRPGYQREFLFFFGDVILGDYLAVAHAFMFAMGVGVAYTRRGAPKQLMGRGVRLFLMGYALNFFRYGLLALLDGLISGVFEPETLEALFGPDILQFAGLALLATGVFRKLKLREGHIFAIGLLLSAVGAGLPFVDTGNYVLNLLLGHFVVTTGDTSCFAFLHWYVFVAAGLLFGSILQRTGNPDRFYRRLKLAAGGVMVVYLTTSCIFGAMFLCRSRNYYAVSLPEAAGLLSIDLFLLSAFHFLAPRASDRRIRVFLEMSRNVTPIYCIHWCLLGLIDGVCSYLLGVTFSWPVIYGIGLMLIIVSFLLARLWRKRKGG